MNSQALDRSDLLDCFFVKRFFQSLVIIIDIILIVLVTLSVLPGASKSCLPFLECVDLVFELLVRGRSEDLSNVELASQGFLVDALADHDVAGLVVSVAVLDHVRTLVDADKAILLQVGHKEQHQALVVQEVLQSLQRELVQVVVNAHNLHFHQGVVLEELEHQLRVDQTSEVED